MTRSDAALVPVTGATAVGAEEFVALSDEPWLALDWSGLTRIAGKFATVTYRISRWDAPSRLLLRFLRDDFVLEEAIAPAPLEAAATWTGRIPAGTTRFHISPTNRLGLFSFRVESIERRSWRDLLVRGYRAAPGPARSALLTKLIGWSPESDHNLAWAINSHPLENFVLWSALRSRPQELDGLDHPRFAWTETPPFHIVIIADGSDEAALQRTLQSLRTQHMPRWQALVVGGRDPKTKHEARIAFPASIADAMTSLACDRSWFCVIPAGVTLRPDALAIVAERRAREPETRMVYGDEIVGPRVVMKPGWSRRLEAASPFLGLAVFAAPALFSAEEIGRLLEGGAWHVPAGVTPLALRRVLLTAPAPGTTQRPLTSPAKPISRMANAALIVLTRNQPALMSRLTASIRANTRLGTYRIVIVDNGDVGGAAAAALGTLGEATDIDVLSRPGPFNFSALCNEAAASCGEDVLVFLNDDMEVLSDSWLDRLVGSALEPDVGAVGARLTYPDGRLQHVGVLVGMGGSAGHFGAPAPGDDPGWAGRNRVLHEVSAVTGACLAVAKKKFEAVGGFDAVHLPIELSDIDLCLKLNARGWQTLIDPAVHLLHEESFSRGGATFRRLNKYGDQRAVFIERWRHVLRDDPVFHPALSLYSWRAALG